ncbi:MAG TPA: efflux RND transporter permease subunit [Planctomycetes bacterium]|nr:efflux RND transporter permease subunit [Planctomycetota bacterium]
MTEISQRPSALDRLMRFCLENKLIVGLFVVFLIGWGMLVAPFDWELGGLPRDPVPVDAIPDIGENQQIVFTKWPGRSPQDVEDQISYPMTVALLGIPGVKTIRSYSMFGFSTIYVVFKEDVEFYWSRSRILEKLNSLPAGTLPDEVQPALGPDATALGQVFWYTLEGRDENGEPTGEWDLQELRSIQDWYVRYGLQAVDGVAEVASIGGYVKEYQIDVDPDAMRAHGVSLAEIYSAVRMSNIDVGARTIELNKVEYVVRGVGFIRSLEDIEKVVVKVVDNVPITVRNVATVSLGPALRRGALDKEGSEAVGGVVVVRYGENPLAVLERVKKKIEELGPGLPSKTLSDGRVSQVTVVPFYDRTGLIRETLGTLDSALSEEIFVTIIVVLVMVMHLRSSILISSVVPLAVLVCFILMKQFGVDANVVALSGIAIAIGTMVDMGIVICENILKHLDEAGPDESRLEVVFRASSEVGSAVLTSVLTTVVSFLPVFTMEAAEGKLFKPLAYTKTFALLGSIVLALTLIPPLAHVLLARKPSRGMLRHVGSGILLLGGIVLSAMTWWWAGAILLGIGIWRITEPFLPAWIQKTILGSTSLVAAAVVGVFLAEHWAPFGPEKPLENLIFVVSCLGGLLLFFRFFQWIYAPILGWALRHKLLFMSMPVALVLFGLVIWRGWVPTFGYIPRLMDSVGLEGDDLRESEFWVTATHEFPGLGKEFMPRLDEGAYLFMPIAMPHASIGEVTDIISRQDAAITAIPEVETAVGKLGRVDSPLDPAPIGMIETIINYKSEYITDESGDLLRFAYDEEKDEFLRDEKGELIPDDDGRPYRQWRDEIRSPDDIWNEIVKAAQMPGVTSATKLQPIKARIVMLQSGMRAPMGIKVRGPDLETIEAVGLELERLLKEVPSVEASAVIADRIVGKPYLEIEIDREAIARYGVKIRQVQDVIEVAVGGRKLTTTVEGRERYPVRVRYARELRDTVESLNTILVPGAMGVQIPLGQLAKIRYTPGPQVIKSEDTFLVGYVLFDMKDGYAEVNVVEDCQRFLKEKIASGELVIPEGVSYAFAGSYENQIRSEKKMKIVLPLALFVIFLLLYFQFKKVSFTFLVFTGVFVAWSGGFLMLWLYGQDWFLDFDVFGQNMRDLFQVHTIDLSVAVWVGFLALFGIATDDGVVMGTYLMQRFDEAKPKTRDEVRAAVMHAGCRRVRPCLMTTATTILALLPVLTSSGRGADIMVPMAIPSFGGMTVELLTMFVVPVLFSLIQETRVLFSGRRRIGE